MKATHWIQNARFTSWWLDFTDLGWPDPHLTAKWNRRAETFRREGVNAVVMFGFHFRWDYLSVMDRVLGALGEISQICHAHGLKVVEHHSATLVHRVRSVDDRREIRTRNNHHVPFYPDSWDSVRYQGKAVADWRQISARDGKPVFFPRYTCECLCPNHPEYQEAYLDYIRTHLAAAPFDALMSDDLHFLPDAATCACRFCQERFTKETGWKLPAADDRTFWRNPADKRYQAWIARRYVWNADHYARLREALPREILLWGCASNCIDRHLADMGFSPQHFAPYFDAVFHEIFHQHQPGEDDVEIATNLAGFASLARHHHKPLVALCYLNRAEDLPVWLGFLDRHRARPWISKQVRREDAVKEEDLLRGGLHVPRHSRTDRPSLQTILFSERYRDSLVFNC